jgi:alanyl-tRNA synthetase
MAEQRQRAPQPTRRAQTGARRSPEYRDLVDAGPTEFTGFDELTSEAKILGIFVDGRRVPVVSHNGGLGGSAAGAAPRPDRVELILDRTPFYAESGGQIADEGSIMGTGSTRTSRAAVSDVQKIAKTLWAHRVNVESGEFVEATRSSPPSSRAGGTARRAIPAPTWCTARCDKCWAPMLFRPAH